MREPSAQPTPSKPNCDGPDADRPDRGSLRLEFPSTARILRSADFRLIYDTGFRVSGPLFAAFCRAREGKLELGPRLGLTVPRAVGKAVIRNRIKRRLREAFRLHRGKLAPKWDIVLNPRRAALEADFAALERELGKIIEKCNSR